MEYEENFRGWDNGLEGLDRIGRASREGGG